MLFSALFVKMGVLCAYCVNSTICGVFPVKKAVVRNALSQVSLKQKVLKMFGAKS